MMDVTAVIDADIAYASDTPARVSFQPGGVAANTAAWMATDGHAVTDRRVRRRRRVRPRHPRASSPRSASTCTCRTSRRADRHVRRHRRPASRADDVPGLRRQRRPGRRHGRPRADRRRAPRAPVRLHPPQPGHPRCRAGRRSTAPSRSGATRSLDPASAAPLRRQPRRSSATCCPASTSCSPTRTRPPSCPGSEDPHAALEVLREHRARRGGQGRLPRRARARPRRHGRPCRPCATTWSTRPGPGTPSPPASCPPGCAGTTLAEAVAEGQRLAGAAVGRVGASPMAR